MACETMTIVLCAVLVVLAVASLFFNVFRRRLPVSVAEDEREETPPLSVVIAVHDSGAELERNLPAILSQDYKPGYEVIVVDESSTDGTADVLKRLKHKYQHLYTTFIPNSSHYLSRRKLALTVGVKAAKNEWIVFTTADCRPVGERWLAAMAAHCGEGTDMVLGYTQYSPKAKAFCRFERMFSLCYQLRKAAKGRAYAYGGRSLAVRKSVFMEHNGFLQNLKYLRGEYDFIVNEYAEEGRTAVAIEAEARTEQDAPTKKTWLNDHLFYMETRKHLSRSIGYRLLNNVDTASLHLNYVAQISALSIAIPLNLWVITATSVLCLVLTLSVRMAFAAKTMAALGEKIPLWRIPAMEIRVAWQRLAFMIKHRLSDKYDFIRR